MNTKKPDVTKTIIDPAILENDLVIEMSVRIWGRHEEIINIKPRMEYSFAMDSGFFPKTNLNLSQILKMLVLEPVQVALNRREEKLFDEQTRQLEERLKSSQTPSAKASSADDLETPFTAPAPEAERPVYGRGSAEEEDQWASRRNVA